jgi:hypothetical protein
MLAFDPNPLVNPDAGFVLVTSLAGDEVERSYVIEALEQDGGLIATAQIAVGPLLPSTPRGFAVQLPDFWLRRNFAPTSWSATDGGVLIAQLLTDEDGAQICTAFGQPCGDHGSCCIGLSCQDADGGCSCQYAWPASTP